MTVKSEKGRKPLFFFGGFRDNNVIQMEKKNEF